MGVHLELGSAGGNFLLKGSCLHSELRQTQAWTDFTKIRSELLFVSVLLKTSLSFLGSGRSECPAYPTELVLGLDMSDDMTPVLFERQRSALLALLEDISVAESNCPTGARVAVVGFSSHTKHLIRFQDYRRKSQLVEAIKNIAPERTSNKRQLGSAMRFVGQNVFKRVRAGTMMRKVAVFFSNGASEDVDDIMTAVMEYRAQNIIPAVISLRQANNVRKALEVGLELHMSKH